MYSTSMQELCKQLRLAYISDILEASDSNQKEYAYRLLTSEIEGRKGQSLESF